MRTVVAGRVRQIASKLSLLVAMAIVPTSASAALLNGGDGVPGSDPPIVVGVDWFVSTATPPAFFWVHLAHMRSAAI